MSPPDKKFQCSDCPKGFDHRGHLHRHQSTVHAQIKEHKCPKCKYEAGQRVQLNRHMLTHHPGTPRPKPLPKKRPAPAVADDAGLPKRKYKRQNPPGPDAPVVQLGSPPRLTPPPQDIRTVNIDSPSPDPALAARLVAYSPSPSPSPEPGTSAPAPDIEFRTPSPGPSGTQRPLSAAEFARYAEYYSDDDDPKSPELGVGWSPELAYTMTLEKRKYTSKFNHTDEIYHIQAQPLPFDDWTSKLFTLLQSVLDRLLRTVPENARGHLVVDIAGLKKPINFTWGYLHEMDMEKLMEKIDDTVNSNDEADLSKPFKMHLKYSFPHQGGNRLTSRPGPFDKRRELDPDQWHAQKKSCTNVAQYAKDKSCLPRCLVAGRYLANHKGADFGFAEYKNLRNSKCDTQAEKAQELCREAGVTWDKPCGLPELKKFQAYLADIQIIVYIDGDHILFLGPEQQKKIYLSLSKSQWLRGRLVEGHYWLISNDLLAGFFATDNFCPKCHRGYNHERAKHRCDKSICKFCAVADCKNNRKQPNPVDCKDCDRTFKTRACFNAHKGHICDTMALCTDCERVVPRKKLQPKDHNCLLNMCRVCNKRFEPGMHMECYVQLVPKTKKRKRRKNTEGALHDPAMPKHGIEGRNPGVFELLGEMDMDMGYPDADVGFGDATEALEGPSKAPPSKKRPKKEKEPKPPQKTFVADFEAETVDGLQRPNLLCIENEQGEALEPFEGPTCGKDFVKALYGNKDWHNSMILFHNGSGYDMYPIMEALYEAGIKPSVIMRDTKNLQVKLPKLDITIRDTFLHIPQSLASMPRAFDFPEMEKGFFIFHMHLRRPRMPTMSGPCLPCTPTSQTENLPRTGPHSSNGTRPKKENSPGTQSKYTISKQRTESTVKMTAVCSVMASGSTGKEWAGFSMGKIHSNAVLCQVSVTRCVGTVLPLAGQTGSELNDCEKNIQCN